MYKVNLITHSRSVLYGVDNLHIFDLERIDGRIVIPKDSSELEFIIQLIMDHKDEGILILRDLVTSEIKLINDESNYDRDIVTIGDEIEDGVPIDKYYLSSLKNPIIREELYPIYKSYSDKMTMVPDYFKSAPSPIEYKLIYLSPDACYNIIDLWYDLHKSPYNFVRFSRATWYPLASLFPILLKEITDETCDSNSST